MTKEQAFKEINDTQEYYVNELIKALHDPCNDHLKEINFTSDTGTGKTNMMALLCNKMPDVYFVITTLSKGQLQLQIRNKLLQSINQDNFVVYGLCDFTANTRLQANEIISRLPSDKQIVWLRDEGHINTNRWQEVINNRCWKIVNISATNKEEGIRCNFAHTMMLRTVMQQEGTPEEALDKLIEVKQQHKKIKKYNPCAIMRCLDDKITSQVIQACEDRNLKYINITEESFDMSELCKDDNEYDVIINKFKIVEGIDLRRAHVLYMTNEPSNPGTTIQIIGRCRRNALLYRNDVDIFKDDVLLKNTRQCYVYYNIRGMQINSDDSGNLCAAFCNKISCEKLKAGSRISVKDGFLDNGLLIVELEGETGEYIIEQDEKLGFNIVKPTGKFYSEEVVQSEGYVYADYHYDGHYGLRSCYRYNMSDIKNKLTLEEQFIEESYFDFSSGTRQVNKKSLGLGYNLHEQLPNKVITLSARQVNSFIDYLRHYEVEYLEVKENKQSFSLVINHTIDARVYNKIFSGYQYEWIDTNSQQLNQELLYLFYGFGGKDKHNLNFKTREELEIFQREHKYVNFILPEGMQKDKAFDIAFENEEVLDNDRFWISNSDIPFSSEELEAKHIHMSDNQIQKLPLIDRGVITLKEIEELSPYYNYTKIFNDKESAAIGVDLMKTIKTEREVLWIEDKAVTSKISKYSKLNTFIQNKYENQLSMVKNDLYNGKNCFDFDTKCNACLGYCSEYYGKYLVYGELFLKKYIEAAKKESKVDFVNDYLIVRACMLMYKDVMKQVYGKYMERLIPTITVDKLIQDEYDEFVKTVIQLGQNIANFVKQEFNIKTQLKEGDKLYDPNLSIKHISGLADFITRDKIIDIKCTSSITLTNIKQVLAYHYLSTKRSDLDIKEVIVFDAVNNKNVRIKI